MIMDFLSLSISLSHSLRFIVTLYNVLQQLLIRVELVLCDEIRHMVQLEKSFIACHSCRSYYYAMDINFLDFISSDLLRSRNESSID